MHNGRNGLPDEDEPHSRLAAKKGHYAKISRTSVLSTGVLSSAINFCIKGRPPQVICYCGRMLRAPTSCGPSGRGGVEVLNFFLNARLRSLFASLCFRSRWKRALSPLIADIVTQAYQIHAKLEKSDLA